MSLTNPVPRGLAAHRRSMAVVLAITLSVSFLGACSSAGSSDVKADTSANTSTTRASDTAGAHGRPPKAQDVAADDDSIKILGEYKIDGDDLVGDVNPGYGEVWARFAELFPADVRPEVTHFVAIDKDKSKGTDGAMQISAINPSERYIALDVTGADAPDELDRTMIHEYSHLLTLRPSQVPADPTPEIDCPVATSDDACPNPGSYLFAYENDFWSGATEASINDEKTINGGPETEESLARFKTGEFVTDYAAVSPTEDIAEVFAEWVLADEEPAGDSVKDQKLRFFDAYPEAVAIRHDIRTNLGY